MPTWSFFLRAVNVTGKNVLRMEDLRQDLSAAGFEAVQTLLASGNVIATLPDGAEEARKRLEAVVGRRLGRPAIAVMRTAEELRALLAQVEPHEARLVPGEVLAVALTGAEPETAALARLAAFDGRGDVATPIPGAILLCCRHGQAGTPYTTDRLERLLGVSITARNPNTLRKVLAKLG